jgi:hypothetical protein
MIHRAGERGGAICCVHTIYMTGVRTTSLLRICVICAVEEMTICLFVFLYRMGFYRTTERVNEQVSPTRYKQLVGRGVA